MTRRDAFGQCGLLGLLAGLWPWGKALPARHDFAKVVRDAMRAYRLRGYPEWTRVRYCVADTSLEPAIARSTVGLRCEAPGGVAIQLTSVKGDRLNDGRWCLTYTFRRDVWLDRFGNLVDGSGQGGFLVPPRIRDALYQTLRMKGHPNA